ncbi:hypothetical protein [Aureibacter tunicatorum]|uniref:Uncharacterized protein n=1 Tax=Aureibacter tunicatorum TaxID=866807 RepID=A0AAE3XJ84_9BACT|nr:hypothetical protein [Aureibacter tunicatorum]MDR6237367.1 hypothetical protein [Aureibacter tunicatorum]BDD06358.1 hypothetical protein AUTU_38410 [Aureibacter tunicatorum]
MICASLTLAGYIYVSFIGASLIGMAGYILFIFFKDEPWSRLEKIFGINAKHDLGERIYDSQFVYFNYGLGACKNLVSFELYEKGMVIKLPFFKFKEAIYIPYNNLKKIKKETVGLVLPYELIHFKTSYGKIEMGIIDTELKLLESLMRRRKK